MTKQLITFLTISVLCTNAVLADVVIGPQSSTHTTEHCNGSVINDQTDGTVKYRAVWRKNTYEMTLDKHADDATDGSLTKIYEKYDDGYYTNAAATTGFTNMQTLPSRTGFLFGGFYRCIAATGETACEQMIDGNGALVTNPVKNIAISETWYAKWIHNCVAKLHVGDDTLCLYLNNKVSSPALVIQSGDKKYYTAMSPESSGKTINSTSSKKLHIKHGDQTYNVHDLTAE